MAKMLIGNRRVILKMETTKIRGIDTPIGRECGLIASWLEKSIGLEEIMG